MATAVGRDVRETRLAHVAAGSATDTATYYYLPMLHFDKVGIEGRWTAGGAGGTVAITLEGTMESMGVAPTPGSASTLTYTDITNSIFGVASWTDDFMVWDYLGKLTCFSHLRVKVDANSSDATTAWDIYVRQVA